MTGIKEQLVKERDELERNKEKKFQANTKSTPRKIVKNKPTQSLDPLPSIDSVTALKNDEKEKESIINANINSAFKRYEESLELASKCIPSSYNNKEQANIWNKVAEIECLKRKANMENINEFLKYQMKEKV